MRLVGLMLAMPLVGCAGNARAPDSGGGASSAASDAAAGAGTVTGTITGTVAYRERMALPADATVEVVLLDVSRQDAAASTLAEATIPPEGRQVPLPFELRYDPAKIEATHTYAVRATIRSEGRLMFTSTTANQVITKGHPNAVNLMLSRVSEAAAPAPAELLGTVWVLEDIGGAGVIDDARATLEFPERGKAAGRGSCNQFFGSVEITGPAIAFGPLGSTRMACAEAVMNQESRYLKALQDAERYSVEGSVLLVYAKGMEQPLRFTRDQP